MKWLAFCLTMLFVVACAGTKAVEEPQAAPEAVPCEEAGDCDQEAAAEPTEQSQDQAAEE